MTSCLPYLKKFPTMKHLAVRKLRNSLTGYLVRCYKFYSHGIEVLVAQQREEVASKRRGDDSSLEDIAVMNRDGRRMGCA